METGTIRRIQSQVFQLYSSTHEKQKQERKKYGEELPYTCGYKDALGDVMYLIAFNMPTDDGHE